MILSGTPRPAGHSLQPYRSSHGYSDAAMVKLAPRLKKAGVTRILRHGFYGEQTPIAFEVWAKKFRAVGMDTGAVYGMGQWTEEHPDEVGERFGSVFAHPLCSMGGLDAEGAYDIIEPGLVSQLGKKLRKVAPKAFIFDQPWPIMNVHSGFPIREFNEFVDEHYPQQYDADFKGMFGKNASPRLLAWSKRSWDAVGVPQPTNITLQGYHHDDNTYDMVDCYFNFPNSVTWCDWEPWESTLMAMEGAGFLRGYAVGRSDQIAKVMTDVKKVDDYRPMTPSRAVVGVFQKEKGLKVDYKAGYDTLAKMGIKKAGVLVSMYRAAVKAMAKAA